MFDCLELFSNLKIKNQIKDEDNNITSISDHLNTLKNNFNLYFLSKMKNYQQMKWIIYCFQEHDMTNGLSIKAKEKSIEIFEDSLLKINFNQKYLINF